MKRVDWTETATRDLREAQSYMADYAPEIGRDVVRRAIAAGRFLLEHPGAGPRLGSGGWRKWRVPRTRYLLIYRPVPTGIEIGRVRYDRSDWRLVPE